MIQFVHLMKLIKPSHLQICKKFYNLYFVHTRNIFIFSFILSITNQFMGDNVIYCNFVHETSIPENMLQSFCYLNGTYTYVNGTIHYHHYYKWIALMLCLEAFLFYLPYSVWSNLCRPYIENIIDDKNENNSQLNTLRCNYILNEIQNSNFCIYKKHLVFEMVVFLNTILQFTLLHILLNYQFFNFGFDVLFPYITTCDLKAGGFSGDANELKITCNLPYNILYKKIFIIIYIWFWCLIVSNLYYFGLNTYTLMKQKGKWTCDQWFLFTIIKYNILGKDKHYIINEMQKHVKNKRQKLSVNDMQNITTV